MNSTPTARDLLVSIEAIAQVDLVYEALEAFGDDALTIQNRINRAAALGYWHASPEGYVVITDLGRSLIDRR